MKKLSVSKVPEGYTLLSNIVPEHGGKYDSYRSRLNHLVEKRCGNHFTPKNGTERHLRIYVNLVTGETNTGRSTGDKNFRVCMATAVFEVMQPVWDRKYQENQPRATVLPFKAKPAPVTTITITMEQYQAGVQAQVDLARQRGAIIN